MEYIIKHNLVDLFELNSIDIQKKICEKIIDEPSATDGPGYVYGFYSKADKNTKNDFKIKLGRTVKNNPNDRIDEWNGKAVFIINTNYNKKLERLIHLFFKFAHEIKDLGYKKEIEWFHFTKNFKINNNIITKNNIITFVSTLDDMLNDVHSINNDISSSENSHVDDVLSVLDEIFNNSTLPQVISDISSDEKSTSSIQNITLNENIKNILTESVKTTINNIINNNSKSKPAFIKSDKQFIFNTISKLFSLDINGEIISISDQSVINDIISVYTKTDYFHVNKRKIVFDSIKKYMSVN